MGVAATGFFLEQAGVAQHKTGWLISLAIAAALCVLGSLIFLRYARGTRVFGGDAHR